MPFCRSSGTHTWTMRPANAKIRAANHCFLCDMTMGAARLIHDLDTSGLIVAVGFS